MDIISYLTFSSFLHPPTSSKNSLVQVLMKLQKSAKVTLKKKLDVQEVLLMYRISIQIHQNAHDTQ